MTEFTGERVIPGEVNDDLWAEHVARYAFAARFAGGRRVLDAGCGTGYGSMDLARSATCVTGVDVSKEAVTYALAHADTGNVRYLQASVTALPFSPGAFDLVTAFEVIEHLSDWQNLLSESRRVLEQHGTLVVSTPNRLYYSESRRLDGPNPYHVHEFEFEEFQAALRKHFSNVAILFQDRVEAFAFHRSAQVPSSTVRIDTAADQPENAHFFVAVCSNAPLLEIQQFVYVPRAANMLREREHHIHLLETDLAQSIADHHALQQAHEEQTIHLATQNRWALELEQQLKAAQERIGQLQDELRVEQSNSAAVAAGYAGKVAELEQENREKTTWAIELEARLTADLAARGQQLSETVRLLDAAEQTVVERTQWAQRLDAELTQLRAQLDMIRESRWVKAGRTVGLGPRLD